MPDAPVMQALSRFGTLLDGDDPELAFAEALSALAPLGITRLFHVDGVVVDANQRLAEMLGYTRDEIPGELSMPCCVAPGELSGVLQRLASHYEDAYVIDGVRKHSSVWLPALHVPPQPVARAVSAAPASGQKVLVVDDEELLRTHLRRALGQRGYRVVEAGSGRGALQALERGQPALVLLDMTMPDLSGVEVLRRMRALGFSGPVVLSSGYHDAALALASWTYQGFLIEPHSLAELFVAVARALEPQGEPALEGR